MVVTSISIWLAGVIGWFLIRLPYQRKSRKTKIEQTARTPLEMTSLVISGLSLGPLPALLIFTGWVSFADRPQYWVLVAGTGEE